MRVHLFIILLSTCAFSQTEFVSIPTNKPPRTKSVQLSIIPNDEQNVTGYNVYYGTKSRTYTNRIDVGKSNTVTISNLYRGNTYYFSSTAYDDKGTESEYSNETSYSLRSVPNIPGIYTITATYIVTNDMKQGAQLFSLCTSSNMSYWKPVGTTTIKRIN